MAHVQFPYFDIVLCFAIHFHCGMLRDVCMGCLFYFLQLYIYLQFSQNNKFENGYQDTHQGKENIVSF